MITIMYQNRNRVIYSQQRWKRIKKETPWYNLLCKKYRPKKENKMKIIFWNTDTQKDFMNKDGALYVQGAEDIKENLKKLTEIAEKHTITVVNTGDYHYDESKELSDKPDFQTTFPKHCMSQTEGCEFIEETRPDKTIDFYWNKDIEVPPMGQLNYNRNIIIYKDKFDVFEGNQHTDNILKELNPEVVVVYGVATNVCVNFAVLGLKAKGKKVYVVKDAIKELPNLPLNTLINDWKNINVSLITTNEVEELINKIKQEI